MKIKILAELIVIGVFVMGLAGVGFYFLSVSQPKQSKVISILPDNSFGWKFPIAKFPLTGSNGKLIAYSSIRDPGGIPQGLPVRLQIPAIGVDSAIEDALITPDGRMDVPAGSVDVAWFALGPHPGEAGSAVIGGHFGIQNGVPFVFYNLDKVKIGDKVYVVNDKGDTLAFQVRKIQSFDRNADSTTVFTSSDGLAHLNIITCEGTWNQVNGAYPQRLVVFTDAIPSEGAIVIKTQPMAVAKPTIAPTIIAPATPPPASNPIGEKATPSPQILIASARSLYATPKDSLITSLLLVLIFFMGFKIIKR